MSVEQAYAAYARGELTYAQYRERYADPEDAVRLERIRRDLLERVGR
jgi:hypothetical protein